MDFHEDFLETERLIFKYLNRTLDAETSQKFSSHYLECDRCFTELRVTELLMAGLQGSRIGRKVIGDVTIFQIESPAHLVRGSRELGELCRLVLAQKDTKVLIDLGQVSRIDSTGLGMLMQCYSHVIRSRGTFKLLNPSPPVQRALSMTKIDSVVEMYHDESEALRAFGLPSGMHPDGERRGL
jgi:anti-sigma B factor antagonist